MEITLTLDEEVVARARELAVRRQTTLDNMVAEYLQEVSAQEAAIEKFVRLAREHAGRSEPGWRFSREECYDRSAKD